MSEFKPQDTAFEHPTTEEAKARYGLYAPKAAEAQQPRLLPDGSGVICDACGKTWSPARGEGSGCERCLADLGIATTNAVPAQAEVVTAEVGEQVVEHDGEAIFGLGAQARVYDLFRADPLTRGDHRDWYKRGMVNRLKPDRQTTAYAAWLAGRHAAIASRPAASASEADLLREVQEVIGFYKTYGDCWRDGLPPLFDRIAQALATRPAAAGDDHG